MAWPFPPTPVGAPPALPTPALQKAKKRQAVSKYSKYVKLKRQLGEDPHGILNVETFANMTLGAQEAIILRLTEKLLGATLAAPAPRPKHVMATYGDVW